MKTLMTPQDLAEYEELTDLRYRSVAYQGPENGYKPYKLSKKEKDRLIVPRGKFLKQEMKVAKNSQTNWNRQQQEMSQ